MDFNSVEQALKSFIFYHYIFISIVPLVYAFNLFTLLTQKNYASINKTLWRNMILLHFLLGVGLLSGLGILAMEKFYFTLPIMAMIVLYCLLMGGEIFRNRWLKSARIAESSMQNYVRYAKGFYLLALILSAGLITALKLA